MKSTLSFLSLLLVVACCLPLSAQSPDTDNHRHCLADGEAKWFQSYQNGEMELAQKNDASRFIPLNVVVVGDNEGAGYIDPITVLNSFKQLNEDFEPTGYHFYFEDISYYNNSSFYEHATTSDGGMIARRQGRGGVYNCFFVERAGGACGYARIEGNYCVLQNNCTGLNDHTWSHEAGHTFSLQHTFYGWESVEEINNIDLNGPAPRQLSYFGRTIMVEKADSSNGRQAADGFSDTPADYLMQGWGCDGNAEYRDSLVDPDTVRFAVNGANYMSYANDNCQNYFSDQQMQAMETSFLLRTNIRTQDNDRGNVAANPADMNLLLPEDNIRTDYSNQVELAWNSVPNADFYLVQVNSNENFGGAVLTSFFTSDTTYTLTKGLSPNRRFYWRVRPFNGYYPDGEFGEQIWRFRTSRTPVSSIDPALDAAITVAPNPVSGGQSLRISGRDLGQSGKLSYELIDPAGRVLLSRQNLSVAATGFTEQLETGQLAAGIYFLRLQLEGKLVTRRVVVTP